MNVQRPCNVAILDNDPFALDGLGALLAGEPCLHVLWTSRLPDTAVARCLDRGTAPDVLLVDMSLGESDSGASVCRHIRKATSRVPILAMTAFSLNYYMKDASLAGAQGIIAKTDREGMAHAIRILAAGGTWGDMFDAASIAHIRLSRQPSRKLLTDRETAVMDLAATGLPLSGVASKLGISESTVKTFISRIKIKLRASSLREAVAIWTGEADD